MVKGEEVEKLGRGRREDDCRQKMEGQEELMGNGGTEKLMEGQGAKHVNGRGVKKWGLGKW